MTDQHDARDEPMRSHVEGFAARCGWEKNSGEGAFEFVQRKCYSQGWQDGRREALGDVHRDLPEAAATKPTKPEQQAGGVPAGFVLVPAEIVDRFPEINPSNYDHDDACALNAWGVELVLAAGPSQSAVQPLSNAQFVKCIETAGFKTWDSRMWSLKREIEASHGIVTKESGND